MKRSCLLAILALSFVPSVLSAQNSAAEKEVYAVVENFFKGFNAKDTTVMKSYLLEDVKLVSTGTTQAGELRVQSENMANFLKSIGSAPVTLDERISNPVVSVEDGLATVWVDYQFYANGNYSHCGVDVFLLAKTATGWKIAALADTRKKTCGK
jgi:hypothetical protein